MKKIIVLLVCFQLLSCHKKKLTEVVEVPLPSKAEKIEIGEPDDVKAAEGNFEMQKFPFKYGAFEPTIDALTLENQYSKIYLNYTNNLNSILKDSLIKNSGLENLSIEEILKKLDVTKTDLRNNAGGFYNQSLYFRNLTTKSTIPKDTLAGAINKDFTSFEDFKKQFSEISNKQFGSGWAWLIVDKSGKLVITTTPNNDNPLMAKQIVQGTPILALDLWEHAYYLKYLNQRKRYIEAYFNILDWGKVGEKYEETLK